MRLSNSLYGVAHGCLTHGWSLLPARKAIALESLIRDLQDADVSKSNAAFWQKHAQEILWPHSLLQFAASVTAVASCICVLSTLLCFTVCILGLLCVAACGLLTTVGVTIVVFGASTLIASSFVAAVSGAISFLGIACTCFGVAAVRVANRVLPRARNVPPGGRGSSLPPAFAAPADLNMHDLPAQEPARTLQDSPLTPKLLSEMHISQRPAGEIWPLRDTKHANPSCSGGAQIPGTTASHTFFSMPHSDSPSLASPDPQSESLGPSACPTNASPISMQLGSESALGAESVRSRDAVEDDKAFRVLQNLHVQTHTISPVQSTAKRRLKLKEKLPDSEGGRAPSVASATTERSVEELMDSAFMGGV